MYYIEKPKFKVVLCVGIRRFILNFWFKNTIYSVQTNIFPLYLVPFGHLAGMVGNHLCKNGALPAPSHIRETAGRSVNPLVRRSLQTTIRVPIVTLDRSDLPHRIAPLNPVAPMRRVPPRVALPAPPARAHRALPRRAIPYQTVIPRQIEGPLKTSMMSPLLKTPICAHRARSTLAANGRSSESRPPLIATLLCSA